MSIKQKIILLAISYCAAVSAQAAIIDAKAWRFDDFAFTGKAGQNTGTFATTDSSLTLFSDAWFGLNLQDTFGSAINFNNNNQFIMNFDISVASATAKMPEITGLWFADFSDKEKNHNPNRTFTLGGTQNYAGITAYQYAAVNTTQSFSIDVNAFISGMVTDIIFINDCDSGPCDDVQVTFSNVSLTDVSEPTAISMLLLGLGYIGWRTRRQ